MEKRTWKDWGKIIICGSFALATLPWSYKYLVPVLRALLIKEIECPNCGYRIDLIGYWRCPSCGFTAPRERHVFLPCDRCEKISTWIECPSCQMSIMIEG